jgi:hypothetical protein
VSDALRLELQRERQSFGKQSASLLASSAKAQRQIEVLEHKLAEVQESLVREKRSREVVQSQVDKLTFENIKQEVALKAAEVYRSQAESEGQEQRERVELWRKEAEKSSDIQKRKGKEWENVNREMQVSLQAMRTGLCDLQSELARRADGGADQLERMYLDHSRMTNTVTSLLAQNEQLWQSSLNSDKLLRSSNDMVTALSHRLYGVGSSTTKGEGGQEGGDINLNMADILKLYAAGGRASEKAEKELIEHTLTHSLKHQLLMVEEKWARKLEADTATLRLQVQDGEEEILRLKDEMKILAGLREQIDHQDRGNVGASTYNKVAASSLERGGRDDLVEELEVYCARLADMQKRLQRLTDENDSLKRLLHTAQSQSQSPSHAHHHVAGGGDKENCQPSENDQDVEKFKQREHSLQSEVLLWKTQVHSLKHELSNALTAPASSSSSHLNNDVNSSSAIIAALTQRIEEADAKVLALSQTLAQMPPSLQVSNAEKRVLEMRLSHAIEAQRSIEDEARSEWEVREKEWAEKVIELQQALVVEAAEKDSLCQRVKELSLTVHQLTQSFHQARQAALNSSTSTTTSTHTSTSTSTCTSSSTRALRTKNEYSAYAPGPRSAGVRDP